MDTYLFDTNLVSVLYDSRRPNHVAVRDAVSAFPTESPQLVSVVTIAELKYGLALSRAAGQKLDHIESCIERAEEHELAGIGRYTADAFAELKAGIASQRLDLTRRIPRWVETWTDRVTTELLQIDENDLWVAAQAIERNYVVVTGDRDFVRVIQPTAASLRVVLL